jgi:hypothetical protein
MTKNKMATRLKASRHDNLFFRDTRLWRLEKKLRTLGFCPQFLSLRAVQKARRGNLLAMTTCQQMAASSYKTPRHDNLFFRDTHLLGFTETRCARFLSLRAVLKSRRANLIASYLHFIASSTYF